jgi:hypothetical protein
VRIINNIAPEFAEQWQIPVIVKHVLCNNGTSNRYRVAIHTVMTVCSCEYLLTVWLWLVVPGESRKVITLEKPLVPQSYTLREKNERFYKAALLEHCSHQASNVCLDFNGHHAGNAFLHAPVECDATNQHVMRENATYNLWHFGAYQILVRCSVDGAILDNTAPEGYRFIGVKSKLEYLADLGDEETTTSESARWWLHTYLRPNAHLLLGMYHHNRTTDTGAHRARLLWHY